MWKENKTIFVNQNIVQLVKLLQKKKITNFNENVKNSNTHSHVCWAKNIIIKHSQGFNIGVYSLFSDHNTMNWWDYQKKHVLRDSYFLVQ